MSEVAKTISYEPTTTVGDTAFMTTIQITVIQNGEGQSANVVNLTAGVAQQIHQTWWDGLGTVRYQETDCNWCWPEMAKTCERTSEGIAAQTSDGAIQGAMIYHVNGRSFSESRQGAIYAQYMATAPWNRDSLVNSPLFSGVGTGLMLRTVCYSYSLGLEGRVTLHSFPDSMGFYTKLGFERTGPEENGTIPCELPPERATEWMENSGLL